MRKVRSAVLAGAAALIAASAAVAAGGDTRFMNVAMPDGSVARIEYKGDVAPTVVVAPAHRATMPVALLDPFDSSPFAMFDRIAAQMDAQADMMMRQVAALQAQPVAPGGKIDLAALGDLPAGTVRYSFVSSSTGDGGTCSRSVQVTSLGSGQAPKVVSNSTGDCIGGTRAPVPAVEQSSTPAPRVTQASLTPAPAAPKPAAALPTI
jgi:hypothetical protein